MNKNFNNNTSSNFSILFVGLLICLVLILNYRAVDVVYDAALPLDLATGAVNTIEYEHHEVHAGSSFTYSDVHSLAKNGVIEHLLVTPDTTKWSHMIIEVGSTGGKVKFEVFEGTNTSDNGDIEPMFNRNRNSNKEPTTILYETPTVINVGTRINQAIYGIKDKKSAGGGDRGTNEWMLKQNTKYLIRVTELNVAVTDINLEFDWYEHTNK